MCDINTLFLTPKRKWTCPISTASSRMPKANPHSCALRKRGNPDDLFLRAARQRSDSTSSQHFATPKTVQIFAVFFPPGICRKMNETVHQLIFARDGAGKDETLSDPPFPDVFLLGSVTVALPQQGCRSRVLLFTRGEGVILVQTQK
jgi:hypothetical protein